jgi:hypothetical protein
MRFEDLGQPFTQKDTPTPENPLPLNSVKTKKVGDYGSLVCPEGGIQAGTAMAWKMSLLTMI